MIDTDWPDRMEPKPNQSYYQPIPAVAVNIQFSEE